MFDYAAAAVTNTSSTTADDVTSRFAYIKSRLREELGDTAFRSWIAPVNALSLTQGALELAAPTRFVRDWLRGHYIERIKTLWQGQFGPLTRIDIIVAKTIVPETVSGAANVVAFTPTADADALVDDNIDPTGLSSALDPRYTFDSFVVGAPNEFAAAAARKVAEGEGLQFNPLVIHSRVGMGKTHLLQAVAQLAREKQRGARVVYMSAEKFMYQFVRALRFKDMMSFKAHLRSIDVLMIDDIQFICGKESTQEEFYHTINALIDQGKQVVVTADRSPAEMDGLEPRLQSRLSGGLVAAIQPFDEALRREVLARKCAGMKRDVPAEVIDLLATRITASLRELDGALGRLIAHTELTGRALTLESAQDLLEDVLRSAEKRVGAEDIQKAVAEHYGIRMADILSPRRARAVARPRQLAMYLCKAITTLSLPDIGRKFSGRDHTTIIHGVRKIEELLETDNQLQADVVAIKRALGV